ncbi:VOC family protein [Chloroflexota bacterium]
MQRRKAKKVSQPSIVQLGFIVSDLQKTMGNYSSLLGVGPFEVVEPEGMGVRSAFARLGPVTLELNQRLGEESLLWKWLGGKAVHLHHFGFATSDLNVQLERFQELGLSIILRGGDGDAGFVEVHYTLSFSGQVSHDEARSGE